MVSRHGYFPVLEGLECYLMHTINIPFTSLEGLTLLLCASSAFAEIQACRNLSSKIKPHVPRSAAAYGLLPSSHATSNITSC